MNFEREGAVMRDPMDIVEEVRRLGLPRSSIVARLRGELPGIPDERVNRICELAGFGKESLSQAEKLLPEVEGRCVH